MKLAALAAAALAIGAGLARAQDPPRFQSSVEVTSLDVTVVDERGEPVEGLEPEDFTVRVDGSSRRVVSAQWIELTRPEGPAPPPPPDGYSTNEQSTGGRLIVIAVDQPNIRFGGALAIQRAVGAFIDRLEPTDRVSAIGFGPGGRATPFTADRQLLKNAIGRMAGQREQAGFGATNVALSEALEMERGNDMIRSQVLGRECAGVPPGPQLAVCLAEVDAAARAIAVQGRAEGQQTLTALRLLLEGLAPIDAPKTLILVTEGFLMENQETDVVQIGALAGRARTSLYALKLENQWFDDITSRRAPTAPFNDRLERSRGLELLTAAARGSLFTVVGDGAGVFARVRSELVGYYLLGVESQPNDRDGKAHPVRVEVAQRGAVVRSRRQLVSSQTAAPPRTRREAMLAGLTAPLVISALPLRVATFSLRGPEPGKVQLLIHADIGSGYASPTPVSIGFLIADGNGRIVDSQSAEARLPPLMSGVPSALQYVAGASLAPGEYTLKLAVSEGDRTGSLEHTIHARIVEDGPLQLSELMVGGPPEIRELLRPTIGHTVTFGGVHGYIEAYGPSAPAVAVSFDIAADPDGPPLLHAAVPERPAGNERTIFSHVVPVGQLPPGKYVFRASVSPKSGGGQPKVMTRWFEVAAPAVLLTRAEGGPRPIVPDIFLPVVDAHLKRPFQLDDVVRDDVVRLFSERVAASDRGAFDAGVAALQSRDFPGAETSFKKAIQIESDSTAALSYLAASFAASGHDEPAASAWQTALIAGSDIPQIYLWLSDALLRSRSFSSAKAILEEAVGKWPADVRFAKPMALMYATFGQGREALRTLVRHVESNPDDVEAMYLTVEWTYHLHAAGVVARTRAEDVGLARKAADVYEQARGPQLALVRQWMAFLENGRR